jgi:SAM-dependent methyltransferase
LIADQRSFFIVRKEHLPILICPKTKRPFELIIHESFADRVKKGVLIEPVSGNEYPVIDFIPRFVGKENYANSFGFQWNLHSQTQHDEFTKVEVSVSRFFNETKWNKDLAGQIILEAGCGSGRFTKHATSTKATVVSFDYSNAVNANYKINGEEKNLLLVQADIFNMPFPDNFFDKAFCFGVLQHTPNPEKAFLSIVKHLKPGGQISSDIYLKSWKNYFHVKYFVRPFVKKLSHASLYNFTRRYVNFFWPVARLLRRSKLGRLIISRFIAERSDQLGKANDDLLRDWAYLDTFDWFSPAYDQPQTLSKFSAWHKQAELDQIEVHYGYNGIEGRGIKRTN